MQRGLAAALLALGAATLLAACSGPKKPQGPVRPEDLAGLTLRVGSPNRIGNRPYLEASGELARAPYRVQWIDFAATPPLLEALRNDDVDIGGNGGSTGILFEAANNGGDAIRIVAAGRSEGTNQGGAAIVVRRDSPLRTLADLRGRQVSVVQGTGTQYILERDLGKLGIGPKDVRWLRLPNDMALAALAAHHIDALGIWEPQASAILQRPDLRLLTWVGTNADTYALQFASAKALADPVRRAAIADFLARLARSTVWASAHPEPFAQAVSKAAGIPPAVARIIVAKTRTRYGLPADEQTRLHAAFATEAAFWRQRGVLHGPVDASRLFDPSFEPALARATAAASLRP